jgi:Uma2 family endonuclease
MLIQDARQRLTVERWDDLPESKLELIDGKLIAGTRLAGSHALLQALLQSCGPRAALPFVSTDRWREALSRVFQAQPPGHWPGGWEQWAAQVESMPPVIVAGPPFDWQHHRVYSLLLMALYRALRENPDAPLGRSIQRFVLRLGDDGLTPDLQVFRRDQLHRLHSYYFDGPSDLVIEVAMPGQAMHERDVKGWRYAAGGVPEYWLFDPASRHVAVCRLCGDSYVEQTPDTDGRYRSTILPGLMLDPARLWMCLDDPQERHDLDTGIVTVEPSAGVIGPSTVIDDHEPWAWEWRPFTPPVDLQPVPISFDYFIEWCPEAKFELLNGLPHIGGWQGTRHVLGLLLMTFGLEATVPLLHPREWVTALRAEEIAHRHDVARRDAWWNRAHQAAAVVRERWGVERVVVLGDLLRPEPLHYWSELTLVVVGLPHQRHEIYAALQDLGNEPTIDLRLEEDLTPRQAAALLDEGVVVQGG